MCMFPLYKSNSSRGSALDTKLPLSRPKISSCWSRLCTEINDTRHAWLPASQVSAALCLRNVSFRYVQNDRLYVAPLCMDSHTLVSYCDCHSLAQGLDHVFRDAIIVYKSKSMLKQRYLYILNSTKRVIHTRNTPSITHLPGRPICIVNFSYFLPP